MPRSTKMQELNNWIKGIPAHVLKVEFKDSQYDRSIIVIARSLESATELCKLEYPAAIKINHLGTFDKVLASI